MAFLFVPIPFCCFQPLQCAAAGLWFVKGPRTAVPPVSRAVVMQGLIRWMFLPEIDIWRRVRSYYVGPTSRYSNLSRRSAFDCN